MQKLAFFASPPSLRILPGNGFPRIGRSARSPILRRRYALFALVGIAGEDDLDAPDLGADPNAAGELPPAPDHRQQSNRQATTAQRAKPGDGKLPGPSAGSVLGVQLSGSLRESLIQQLPAINSPDEAAAWAQRNLPAKNKLTAADAKMVEERFQARLLQIDRQEAANERSPAPVAPASAVAVAPATQKAAAVGRKRSPSLSFEALGKPVRLRDKDHRRFVLRQACLVCGRVPSDPHHLTFTQPRALGRRVSDEFIVPVCRVHHRELHRSGDEVAWWHRLNIDPVPVALKLWQRTRSDGRSGSEERTESKTSTQGKAPDQVSKPPA